jgi:putative ABC transport system permease protein
MRYLPLVWAALRRRPVRSALTFASILVAFILFGLMAAVSSGISHVVEMARLDRLYTAPRFGTPLPYAYIDKIARVPGVTIATPQVNMGGYFRQPKNVIPVTWAQPAFFAAHPELTISKDQLQAFAKTRTGAVISVTLARDNGWKVGDIVPVTSATLATTGGGIWRFQILAVVEDTDFADFRFMVGNYDYFDKARAANQGTVNIVTAHIADPYQAAAIGRKIDDLFANSPAPTRTISEKASLQSGLQSLGDINVLTRAVIGAVLFTLLFLTGNTMMQSVRERVPELGVMKTLGFSDGGIITLVFAESLILCALAGLAGLLVVKFGFGAIVSKLPPGVGTLILINWRDLLIGLGFALAVALISTIVPALRVRRLNVVDALAGR